MKINIGKNDICFTCRQGKRTKCSAGVDDIFFDDTGNIADCKRYAVKEKVKPAKRFIKPTVEEIAGYVKEKGYTHTDPQAFFDYYESVDWYRGSTKIKNWKMAVAGWNKRQKEWSEDRWRKEQKGKLESTPSYDLDKVMAAAMDNTDIC